MPRVRTLYSNPGFERHHRRWVLLDDTLQLDPDPVVFLRLWYTADLALAFLGRAMPHLVEEVLDLMESLRIDWDGDLGTSFELPEEREEEQKAEEVEDDIVPKCQGGLDESVVQDEKERSMEVKKQERQASTENKKSQPDAPAPQSRLNCLVQRASVSQPTKGDADTRDITKLVKYMISKSMKWQEIIYWVLLSRQEPGFNFQGRYWEL